LENREGDWISLESVTLTGYRSSRTPQMHLYGLTNGRMAILRAQNPAYNWKNVFEKRPIPPLPETATTVHGLPPGRYRVEWWDTERGAVRRTETAVGTRDGLPLRLPELPADIAARIVPEAGNSSMPAPALTPSPNPAPAHGR